MFQVTICDDVLVNVPLRHHSTPLNTTSPLRFANRCVLLLLSEKRFSSHPIPSSSGPSRSWTFHDSKTTRKRDFLVRWPSEIWASSMAFSGPLPEGLLVHHANFLLEKAPSADPGPKLEQLKLLQATHLQICEGPGGLSWFVHFRVVWLYHQHLSTHSDFHPGIHRLATTPSGGPDADCLACDAGCLVYLPGGCPGGARHARLPQPALWRTAAGPGLGHPAGVSRGVSRGVQREGGEEGGEGGPSGGAVDVEHVAGGHQRAGTGLEEFRIET